MSTAVAVAPVSPICPFVYCQTPNTTISAKIEPTPASKKKEATKLQFYPCKDFNVVVTKDDDWNIDVYLHVNPKNIALCIPAVVKTVKAIKKSAK